MYVCIHIIHIQVVTKRCIDYIFYGPYIPRNSSLSILSPLSVSTTTSSVDGAPVGGADSPTVSITVGVEPTAAMKAPEAVFAIVTPYKAYTGDEVESAVDTGGLVTERLQGCSEEELSDLNDGDDAVDKNDLSLQLLIARALDQLTNKTTSAAPVSQPRLSTSPTDMDGLTQQAIETLVEDIAHKQERYGDRRITTEERQRVVQAVLGMLRSEVSDGEGIESAVAVSDSDHATEDDVEGVDEGEGGEEETLYEACAKRANQVRSNYINSIQWNEDQLRDQRELELFRLMQPSLTPEEEDDDDDVNVEVPNAIAYTAKQVAISSVLRILLYSFTCMIPFVVLFRGGPYGLENVLYTTIISFISLVYFETVWENESSPFNPDIPSKINSQIELISSIPSLNKQTIAVKATALGKSLLSRNLFITGGL